MKDYIEERAVELAYYIIKTKSTVRQTARCFGISKSTVHKDITERLKRLIRLWHQKPEKCWMSIRQNGT